MPRARSLAPRSYRHGTGRKWSGTRRGTPCWRSTSTTAPGLGHLRPHRARCRRASQVLFGAGLRRECVLKPGELAVYESISPYTLLFDEGVDQCFLRFPRAILALPDALLWDTSTVTLGSDNPLVSRVHLLLPTARQRPIAARSARRQRRATQRRTSARRPDDPARRLQPAHGAVEGDAQLAGHAIHSAASGRSGL
ncbi:hypothetical protein OKJ48_29125 [Streptomyces kunmingensis]|uniref:Transcription regulator HTH AraC- type ligand binding domain-containing protein n=2 Tax=Streptomyces kunmingensis TaxID=68225 RepID=A0ABU6CHT3_9ACTN|nr:hypothetical protein [Streptomyces kunmingensis]